MLRPAAGVRSVGEWSGIGLNNTPTFEVQTESWAIDWTIGESEMLRQVFGDFQVFSIAVHREGAEPFGDPYYVAPLFASGKSGRVIVHGRGRFYLAVFAAGDQRWRVRVATLRQ